MMSNNGQAVTNTTGSVTSLLGVGEFSWRVNSKGHLISKCLFGVIVSTKIAMKIISALKIFMASLGLSGNFFWASWGLS